MSPLQINPYIQELYYINIPGKKDYQLNLDIFKNDQGTATEQIISDFRQDFTKNTDTLYTYLKKFVNTDSFDDPFLKENFDSMFKDFKFSKDTKLVDIINILDMSNSHDLIQYLKLINQSQSVKTLFEILDYSKNKHIIFTNPSQTKQYMLSSGVYPYNRNAMGGTYSIQLFEKEYDASNKTATRITQFNNNEEVYSYIMNYGLLFDY